MRSFKELQESETMFLEGETVLGTRYVLERADGNSLTVQRFEHAGVNAVHPYRTLHEAAHLWVHDDLDHDAWLVLDVDEPLQVGVDFAVIQRRDGEGNSIRQFEFSDDPAPVPPRLAELRALIPRLCAAAKTPQETWISNLVASRVMRPDDNTIFITREKRFYIQDLAPTLEELREWTIISTAASSG